MARLCGARLRIVPRPGAETYRDRLGGRHQAAGEISGCRSGQDLHELPPDGSNNVARVESSHAKNQVSCVTCHKIHANGPMGLVPQGYAAINTQCAGCHLNVWAQFQKPNHHRVPENAMSCVDCHNPHGSIRPASQQSFRRKRPGMPELPRRQARTVRLRARAGALRGLRDVP